MDDGDEVLRRLEEFISNGFDKEVDPSVVRLVKIAIKICRGDKNGRHKTVREGGP